MGTEECDDGNEASKDGCASCQVESDWQCNSSSPSSPSLCSYVGQLELSLKTVTKQDDSNSLLIILDLKAGQNAEELLKNIDFEKMISIEGGLGTVASIQYDLDSGTVTLKFDYNQDIHGAEFALNFDPALSNSSALQLKGASTVKFAADPQNNLQASYYDQDDYALTAIVKYLVYATCGLFLMQFLLAISRGKIIGVESIAVAQFAFISLICLRDMSPTFSALKHGLIVCIFIPLLGGSPSLEVGSAEYVRGMDLYSSMFQNFSIDLVLILLPIVIGLVLLMLSMTILKTQRVSLKPWTSKFLYEYAFHLLLFSSYLGFAGVTIEFLRGSPSSSGRPVSLVVSVLFVVLALIYAILFGRKRPSFGEYHSFFDKERGVVYGLMMAERLLLGTLPPLLAHLRVGYAQPVFMGILLLYCTGVCIKKPYLELSQNYRQIANYSIAVAIQGVYLLPTFIANTDSKLLLYAPLAILALLLTCLVYNFAFLLKQICKKQVDIND
jgi:cysteine-rich repeat protein